MKVYELRSDVERHQLLRPAGTTGWEDFWEVVGTPLRENWARVRVRLFRELDDFEKLLPSDFPHLTAGVPVLTAWSLSVLRDLVEPFAEVLPLVSEDGEFYALNVTTLPAALNYERSEVTYYRSTGRVMKVERYAFIPERVAGLPIFKLPEFPRSRVYVTDPFVERVREHGLTGFEFNLLWEG